MIAVVKLTKLMAKEIDLDSDRDLAWMDSFVSEGMPVILVNDLDDLTDLSSCDFEDVVST